MLPWPGEGDPTGVIKEALREYVGDGDGADEWVLAKHDAGVVARALRAEADNWTDETGLSISPVAELLRIRANRIEKGE